MTSSSSSGVQIRWGILGSGMILGKLGPSLAAARGSQLIAIASRDANRAEVAAAQQGALRAHGSYDELLADPDIDVVWNALHNGLHCEWTVRALQAGKHVLCEKPLAVSAAEVETMYAAAQANNRCLMEGFMYRFHPQMAFVNDLIRDGALGDLVHVGLNYLSGGRDRTNPRYTQSAGGGALLDLGCYCVNFARWIARHEPERVTAHSHFDDESGVDLTTSAMLQFAGGLTAEFACSFESEGVYDAHIVGRLGRLHIPHPWRPPQWPAQIELVRDQQTVMHRIDPPGITHDPLGPFILEIEHFAACVRNQQPPTFPGAADVRQESWCNARVLEAIALSARERCTVEL